MNRIRHDREAACTKGTGFGQQLLRLGFGVEHATGDAEQLLAGGREDNLFALPIEQENVVILFEFVHLIGNRRLGQ